MLAEEELTQPVVDSYILPEHRTTKPQGSQIGFISNQVTKYPIKVDMAEMACQVGIQGYTMVPCLLNGSKRNQDNFLSTQLVVIDVDNGEKVNGKKVRFTGEKYLSIKKVMADPFTKANAAFLYESFSSTVDWERFHIVFRLDKVLDNLSQVQSIYKTIGSHYTNYDNSVVDPTRLVFGGNHLHVINLSNTFGVVGLHLGFLSSSKKTIDNKEPQVYKTSNKKTSSSKGSDPVSTVEDSLKVNSKTSQNKDKFLRESTQNNQVLNMIKNGRMEEVKEEWKYYFQDKSMTESEFYNQATQLDLVELLDLPTENPFLDIFHEENNPSAVVFTDKETGRSLYKCFSQSAPFTGNLFEVAAKLMNISVAEAFYKVAELFQINLTDSFQAKMDKLYKVIRTMKGKSFSEKYPNTNKYFNNYLYDVKEITKMVRKNGSYLWMENGEIHHIFYMSAISTAKKLYGEQATKGRTMSIRKLLNLMTLTGWLNNIADEAVPEIVLSKLNSIKMGKKGIKRRINVYEISDIPDNFLDKMEETCKLMAENGVTMKGLSKELVINLLGQEESDRVYVQDAGRTISKESHEIENMAVSIINRDISQDAYSVEKKVEKELGEMFGKSTAEYKMKQIRPSLIQNYGLKRVRLTAKVRKQLGIPAGKVSPVVYIAG